MYVSDVGVETFVEQLCYGFLVHFLSDEDEFLHSVSVYGVPVSHHSGVVDEEVVQFVFRHGGIPLSCVSQADLFSCLFKDVADVFFAFEIAYTLCPDDGLRPFSCHEMVKFSE